MLKPREGFNSPEELIEDIRNGKMVILIDDEDRENEGDLVLAADHVTSQAINFMATQARGLICLSLSPEQIERLQLPLMVRDDLNDSPNKTAFTVSIEAASGVTTGISVADRAHTIRVAANPNAKPNDLRYPGHIFPIRAQQGGVLKRAGHTEGSIDLSRMAGLNPAAVICEVMNPDGTMARVPDLMEFSKKHQLKIGTIVDLIEYRLQRDNLVEEIFQTDLPSSLGGFKVYVFRSRVDGVEHLVLQKGTLNSEVPALVRVHQDSYTKDLFQRLQDHESTLKQSLRKIEAEGAGVLLLLRGNNRPTGLTNEIRALLGERVQSDMDLRDYGIGAQILRALGIHKIRLLSHRVEPGDRHEKLDKRVGLKAFDLEIVETVGIGEDGP